MATISINIPDDELQRILDLFAQANGYQTEVEVDPTLPATANPESKRAFMGRMIVERINAVIAEQEVQNQVASFRRTQRAVNITAS